MLAEGYVLKEAITPIATRLTWLHALPVITVLRVPSNTLNIKAHLFSHRSSYLFILALRMRIHHAHSIRRAALKATSRMRRRTTAFTAFIIGSRFNCASWFAAHNLIS